MRLFFLFAILSVVNLARAYTESPAGTFTTDGSQSDVASAISAATDGEIVVVPSGNFTWTSTITISGKGIHLQGAGAGRCIATSTSSVEVGTGSKSFTVASGLAIEVDDILTIERTGTAVNPSTGNATGTRTYMTGAVTSYSGTTLTINATTTAGSGTHGLWMVSTQAITTVTYATTDQTPLLTLTEDVSHNVELSGIRFLWGTGAGEYYMITLNTGTGKPILIHDCYFEFDGEGSHIILNWQAGHRGVVWDSTFAGFPFAVAGTGIKVAQHSSTGSWTSASTMGAADTTGLNNIYIEDCDFHAMRNATDFDGNSRSVMRYCLFDNAGTGTHGADSGNYGVRHYEWYNNEFVFTNLNSESFALTWFFFLRGGTGVFTDNDIDNISSSWWGNKDEFSMAILNLNENWGPNPCWGADDPGVQYPCPRQVGLGYVTGSGTDGLDRTTDSVTYVGDSEPVYIWGNTGSTPTIAYSSGGGGCTNPDSAADYIVEDRDYFVGTAKPGYSKYTYPHPLRGEETPPVANPRNHTGPTGANSSIGIGMGGNSLTGGYSVGP